MSKGSLGKQCKSKGFFKNSFKNSIRHSFSCICKNSFFLTFCIFDQNSFIRMGKKFTGFRESQTWLDPTFALWVYDLGKHFFEFSLTHLKIEEIVTAPKTCMP